MTFILRVLLSCLEALREGINKLSRAEEVREGALEVKALSRVMPRESA